MAHLLKARWKSLTGIILLFAAMITVIAVSPLTDASASETSGNSGEMTITKNLVLEWETNTTGNSNKGRHFETIEWTFTVYEGTTQVGKLTVPVEYLLKNGASSSGDFDMVYKWNLNNTSDSYAVTLKGYIDKVEGEVRVIANPTVQFYDNSVSPKKIYTTVNTKTAADDYADEFFYHNGKRYFENYFNKNVTIEAARLKVKTGSDTEDKKGIDIKNTLEVDGKSVELSDGNKYISKAVWYGINDKDKATITVNLNDGYTFDTASSSRGAEVTKYSTEINEKKNTETATIKTSAITSNTTVVLEAKPVKVKIVYYLDEDGDGTYETKAGYYTYTYGDISNSTAQLGYNIDSSVEMNGYTKWYTDEDESGDSYKFNREINDSFLWKLYGTRDGEVQHRICLYASKESNDPTDGDYKIVYDGNGATSGSMTDQYATYGTTTMLKTNAYTKTGYHTDKDDTWVSENNSVYYAEAQSVSDATLDFDDSSKTVVTLNANWKPNECTIVYNGNGATSGTVKKQTITYDDWTTELRENKFSKTGTSFDSKLSWNTEPDGSGTTFAPGTLVKKSVWKQLFGDVNANGVKITLYAIWGDTPASSSNTERETWELASLGGGQLTYVNPLDNDTDGPYAYEWTGSLSLLQCMFGTKYDTATTEYVTYDTGFQTTTEQQMFMITAGSTIYKGDADEDWYKFFGWSIDEYAQYGDSDSIILAAGQTMSGEDLGAYAMAYKYPIKYNSKWDTMSLDDMMENGGVPEPTSTSLPSKSNLSGRASVISEAAKAWKTYKTLLENEVEAATAKYNEVVDAYDEAVDAYNEAVDTYNAKVSAYNSAVAYRNSLGSAPSQYYYITKEGTVTYTYTSGCTGPYTNSAYTTWSNNYSSASAAVSSASSAKSKAKTAMNKAEDEMDEAEEEMNEWKSRVDSFTSTYNTTIDKINNTISDTRLYAVWDKFPIFEDMDEIAINEVDITGISDLASWLWQYVTVTDREDITLTNGTDVVLENKDTLIAELQQLEHTGSVSVTFRATDSAGNVTKYTTNIWMNDKDPLQTNVLAERINYENGYTRFISREYYELGNPDNYSSEQEYLDRYVNATGLHTNEDGSTTVVPYYLYCGGLHPKSLWYTDPEYKAEILNAFDNEENGTPEEVWTFTYDDIQDIKAYIDTYGIGDTYGEGRLKNFYNTFKHCCTVYKQPFQDTYK